MPDMLVKLYELPDYNFHDLEKRGIKVRVANPWEKSLLIDWVRLRFSSTWADEVSQSFNRIPATTIIATKAGKVLGFACYDCSRKGFFGPTGVAEEARKQGIGKALLFEALTRMYADGYAYAVIGWAGPTKFYENAVSATIIEGSEPGIYSDLLEDPKS